MAKVLAPSHDPAATRSASKDAPTVSAFGVDYLAEVRSRRKETTAREYGRLWSKHIVPAMGSRRLADVQPADVARLHRAMRSTPYNANRTLSKDHFLPADDVYLLHALDRLAGAGVVDTVGKPACMLSEERQGLIHGLSVELPYRAAFVVRGLYGLTASSDHYWSSLHTTLDNLDGVEGYNRKHGIRDSG